MLCGLEIPTDPNLIVGIEGVDDAGVYKISEEIALVHTVDFFTPVVDDPYFFGQIAVANALSDVYAMGGKPLTAMNIVCFPVNEMEISILQEILRGGLEKMKEAGVILVGGHTVEDKELKYGLAVIGLVHPEKVIKNKGAKVKDKLVLTKPLGTGIISTAIKASFAEEAIVKEAIEIMTTLNKGACEAMVEVGVNACTDVTGFGLLGHAAEMIEDSPVGMVIHAMEVPKISEVEEYAETGLIPAGTYRNKDFRKDIVDIEREVPSYLIDLFFDPQTSGGLLISVSEEKLEDLMDALRRRDVKWAKVIGEIVEDHPGRIRVTR